MLSATVFPTDAEADIDAVLGRGCANRVLDEVLRERIRAETSDVRSLRSGSSRLLEDLAAVPTHDG